MSIPDTDRAAKAAWAAAWRAVDGLPGGGLNLAHEAVDRHVRAGHGDRIAVRCLARDGPAESISYGALMARSARFAGLLDRLGLDRGQVICSLLGRSPALFVTALGTLRAGAVFCPLFQAYGPDPIRARITRAEAAVVVTTRALFERKLAPILPSLPSVRFVLLAEEPADSPPDGAVGPARVLGLDRALADCAEDRPVTATGPADPALLFFTSGTTGTPKGALHAHEAVVAQHATARAALDLRPADRYWCTADPGWVTGTVYGVFAPLTVGATVVADREEFDAARWAALLAAERIAVWYTAPTAVRLLMRAEAGIDWPTALPDLRLIASVGEPLGAAGVAWGRRRFGRPIRETWWQTETGAIMIHHPGTDAVPDGALGRPIAGVEAAILPVGEDRPAAGPVADGTPGVLALKTPWPSLFRTYIGEEERYRACFRDGWYVTGDLASRDEHGVFWFIGRADDVIKSAGHLIGPFEVESCLLDHPAVAEACVVGRPDSLIGQVVEAHVVVRSDHAADAALSRTLLAHARRRLGPAVAPRSIVFTNALPKTGSGKIMRRAVTLADDAGDRRA